MKEFRFRIIIILGAIALSIYLLYPTYADYDYSQEINQEITSIKDSISTADPLISNEKLDQILTAKEEAKISDLDLVSILARKFQERGIRLSRYFGTIRQSDSDITDQLQQQESDAVNR